MIAIFFLVFLAASIFLVSKYDTLQEQFFLVVEKMDRDQLEKFDLYNESAIKLHLNRMRYFKVKPYLDIKDDKLNSIARRLTLLNRLGTISILFSVGFAVLYFLVKTL